MQYGTLSLTTDLAYKPTVSDKEITVESKTIEQGIPGGLVQTLTNPNGVASVSCTLGGKISDEFRYGDGTWDKVPYSIYSSATVTLRVDQSDEAINAGYQVAQHIAWTAVRGGLVGGVDKLFKTVQEVMPGLFDHLAATEVPDGGGK